MLQENKKIIVICYYCHLLVLYSPMTKNLTQNFPYAIGSLLRDARRHNDEQFKSFGLSRYEWLILAMLHKHDGLINQNAIKEYVGIEISYLTKILDKLEAKEFITKEIDPDDRRNRLIKVNPKACPTLRKIYQKLDDFNNSILTDLNEKEKLALFNALEKIHQRVKQAK